MALRVYRLLLWVQATYMLLTALWGLLHIESFMEVTGPKYDVWLVKTVSVLLLSICAWMYSALFLKVEPLAVIISSAIASAGLAAIDFYYTSIDRIRWVYALDGAAEMFFLLVWTWLFFNREKLTSAAAKT